MDERFVRNNVFKGQHVVRIETERDSITGKCKGKS